jgi:sn1-specific diacylglycerol lipase
VATVLAILLRQRYSPRIDVRCFAYSPPGATLCATGSDYAADFVTSLIIGYDMVPRLNMRTLRAFKREMTLALSGTTQSKYIINGGPLATLYLCGKVNPWWLDDESEKAAIDPPAIAARRRASVSDKTLLSATASAAKPVAELGRHMFVPGRVVHLVRVGYRGGCFGGFLRNRVYRPVWRDREYFATELLVNGRMALDHFPDYVAAQLEAISPADLQAALGPDLDSVVGGPPSQFLIQLGHGPVGSSEV